MKRRRAGFTLVELIVVIGITLVLAAIVLSVMGRAKAQSRQTQSVSNLRQITVACLL